MPARPPLLLAASLLLATCGGSTDPQVVFGADDRRCTSIALSNSPEDADLVDEFGDCLAAAYLAGVPFTADVSRPTVEGDPIYTHFAYDGETVLIVTDNRLDQFGTGTVTAEQCAELIFAPLVRFGDWMPMGEDCTEQPHGGFVESN